MIIKKLTFWLFDYQYDIDPLPACNVVPTLTGRLIMMYCMGNIA